MSISRNYHLKWDLALVDGLCLALAGVTAASGTGAAWLRPLRVILGLPFVLFFPGYVLIAALFPGRKALDGLERTALSFGLSIAVVPLVGLGLNYTPWGIRLTPILVSLTLFTLVVSAAAYWRRRGLDDPYYPVFHLSVPRWSEMGRADRILSLVLAAAVLFAAGSIVYVVGSPKTGEKFTEFYVLGPGGKAADYPRDLAPGQNAPVIVGVVNHEYAPVTYYVEVTAGGWVKDRTAPFQLTGGQKWEREIVFSVYRPQENLKVEFLLFRLGDTRPYRSLHLWVNVAPKLPGNAAVQLPPSPEVLGGPQPGNRKLKAPSITRAVYR